MVYDTRVWQECVERLRLDCNDSVSVITDIYLTQLHLKRSRSQDALAPLLDQLNLGVANVLSVLWLPLDEAAIALHVPGAPVVLQVELQQALQSASKVGIFHGCHSFHPAVQVATHPVCASDVHLR